MKKLFDRQSLGIALALIVVTLAAYWPVFQADFVNYDDPDYVTQNPQVQAGLTWAGIKWAFTTDLMGSWHPVTWLSHMTDVQCFGVNPGAHHAVSLGLHVVNVLLVLVLFRRLTGELRLSAVAAALFALHPLHVESVAWISERKDVLSGFFGLLSLLAYTSYARPSPSSILHPPSSHLSFLRSATYWLAGLFLALGLLSKPMLVTWPFLMLLLDWWPLGRLPKPSSIFHLPSSKWLLVEKLPFLLIVFIIAVLTVFTQQGSEAVISLQELPLPNRLANVLNSVLVYVTQFFWPTDLAPFYPFVLQIGSGRLLVAGAVMLGLCILAFVRRHSSPWLGVGWLWYLIALLPVCGLVQVGFQSHADRYTYLPSIGLGLALVWCVAALLKKSSPSRPLAPVASVLMLGVLGWRTHVQARLWQGSEPLFRHALAVTQGNFMAHQGLAEALLLQDKMAEAREHFLAALAINPRMPSVRNNLAVLSLREGKYAEAIAGFQQVLAERPGFAMAHFNLAEAQDRSGQPAEALLHYQEFLKLQPGDLEARLAVARCLTRVGKSSEALAALQSLCQDHPVNVVVSAALAAQWQIVGNGVAAVAEYERAVKLSPDAPELCNNLAWLLATHPDVAVRNGARAVQLAEKANQLTGNHQAFLLGTLAAAYAEAGRFPEAVATALRAIESANSAGQTQIATRNTELLELYRASKSYHEPAR